MNTHKQEVGLLLSGGVEPFVDGYISLALHLSSVDPGNCDYKYDVSKYDTPEASLTIDGTTSHIQGS
jgi:hypothetical protein